MGKRKDDEGCSPFPVVDDEGWPTAWNADEITPEKSRQSRFVRDLSDCARAYKAGSDVALLDVVETCSKFDRPLPTWAAEAVKTKLRLAFRIPVGKRGRTANGIAIYRQRQIDYERWDCVRELLGRKNELVELGHAITWTDDAVFETASKMLEETPAYGKAGAVRKSYLKVQREMKWGRGPLFYMSRSRID